MKTKEETEAYPNDGHLPAKRRNEILRMARDNGQVIVTVLSEIFDVSLDTIRRDLDMLSERGFLTRTHGGAIPADPLVMWDRPLSQRQITQAEAKSRIAVQAACVISDRETLFINGGSTTLAFARELKPRRGLTVVTNNLLVPSALPPEAVANIYLLGGQYQQTSQVAIGAVGFNGPGTLNADTAVIGVGGVSASGGLSTTHLEEAAMIGEMMRLSRRVIVVADATKLGRNAFAHIAPLADVDLLVTDTRPAPDIAAALDQAGIEVLVG